MGKAEQQSLISIVAILAIGAGIAWAGGQGGARVGGFSAFALCGALGFVINWIVFVPSYRAQTEHYFDLTGSVTYVSVVTFALLLGGPLEARSAVLAALIYLWAGRLGTFLFRRISRDGGDGRFDKLKPSFLRFLMVWTLQGLWVFLTAACALAAMTTANPQPFGALGILGLAVWIAGFTIEVLADGQKSTFRADPANRGRFIQSGLWSWSRHPNYFGEITLWLGVALIALPVLSGWQYVTLISPVFVYVLLTRISGIPLLEARADARWGDDPEYLAYRDQTPALFPKPPTRATNS